MKKLAFIFLLGLAFTACDSDPVEEAVFNEENNNKPEDIEIIDEYNDTSHGLGN